MNKIIDARGIKNVVYLNGVRVSLSDFKLSYKSEYTNEEIDALNNYIAADEKVNI